LSYFLNQQTVGLDKYLSNSTVIQHISINSIAKIKDKKFAHNGLCPCCSFVSDHTM